MIGHNMDASLCVTLVLLTTGARHNFLFALFHTHNHTRDRGCGLEGCEMVSEIRTETDLYVCSLMDAYGHCTADTRCSSDSDLASLSTLIGAESCI